MRLNLETKTKEQELVKAYLEKNASEILAEKINNGTPFEKDGKTFINKKTLDGFMKYASDEARKLASKGANSACVEDKVVYGWAVHYFEEDSIEGTLFNADGTEYKPAPKSAPTKVKKVEPKKTEERQPTLFDFMEPEKSEPEANGDDEDEQPSQEEIDEILAEIAEEENKKATQKRPSPFYEKYLEIEHSYPDYVIAYRLGDFYEVFGEKAVQISEECNLTLTGRDVGLENRIPMVGFPYHAAELYFDKIQRNHRLVIVNSDGTLKELSKPQTAINLDTGEIYDEMTEEEMREFDGDLEEPQDIDDDPEDLFDATAFDKTALCKLDTIFGDKLALR
ncbi:MAG: Cas9 inhibitor AcrIIA9 family protein [Christensenellales bacterium]